MRRPPLHIGLLTADLTDKHGWGAYALNLIVGLRDQGMHLTIVSARNTPARDDIEARPLLPPVAPRAGQFVPRQILSLPHVASAFQGCDIIHSTLEPYALIAALAAGRRPLLITGHGSYVRLPIIERQPYAEWYRRAFLRSRLVCVSRYTARAAGAAVPGLSTSVVNNGSNSDRFRELPPPPEKVTRPTVLFVGAVKARKGVRELVRALDQVRQQIPDVQLVIIGTLDYEPAYVAEVRADIARLGLEQHVRLLGRLPETDMLGWYGAADVFVMPALNDGWKFEGFGLSLLDASAAGLPVIGTSGSGTEDAVDPGVTGLLVNPEQLDTELPAALLTLLTDTDKAARMGKAGRALAERLSWTKVAREMTDLYHQVWNP